MSCMSETVAQTSRSNLPYSNIAAQEHVLGSCFFDGRRKCVFIYLYSDNQCAVWLGGGTIHCTGPDFSKEGM